MQRRWWINGSVKAKTSYAKGEDDSFVVGLGASVLGDAEFSNIHQDGNLGLLVWNPDDENRNIKVLGGNGAEGNLVLQANKDVDLLGDANAAHDIEINSTDGSFSGIGRGIQAGNDVRVSVGEGVYYMGGTLQAGNDIDIQVKKPVSEDSGIYIGALPEGMAGTSTGETSLTAGNEINFDVNGNGNIALEGNVAAENGDVIANISSEGSIVITESVESKNSNVTMQTGKGSILINDSINAGENVSAKVVTEGDITIGADVTAGNDVTMTSAGTEGDITVGADVTAGNDVTMKATGTEGDISVGSAVSAGNNVTMETTGTEGDISVGSAVSAGNNVKMETAGDKGDISVDAAVTATQGNVAMQTATGDITVGDDVTATQGSVAMQTVAGDITVGAEVTAGEDVTMKAAGTDGDITVGSAVSAGNDVTMETAGDKGDITVGAGRQRCDYGNCRG